ncbi:MAG: hypothetical protein NVV62_14170 [Terricaulis sp.]|nr:hypothetical protein [Terricaulis sp.]
MADIFGHSVTLHRRKRTLSGVHHLAQIGQMLDRAIGVDAEIDKAGNLIDANALHFADHLHACFDRAEQPARDKIPLKSMIEQRVELLRLERLGVEDFLWRFSGLLAFLDEGGGSSTLHRAPDQSRCQDRISSARARSRAHCHRMHRQTRAA